MSLWCRKPLYLRIRIFQYVSYEQTIRVDFRSFLTVLSIVARSKSIIFYLLSSPVDDNKVVVIALVSTLPDNCFPLEFLASTALRATVALAR